MVNGIGGLFTATILCLTVTLRFNQGGDDLNGFMSRFLHNHTALDLLQSLQMHGLSLVILPVRVAPTRTAEAVPDAAPEAVPV